MVRTSKRRSSWKSCKPIATEVKFRNFSTFSDENEPWKTISESLFEIWKSLANLFWKHLLVWKQDVLFTWIYGKWPFQIYDYIVMIVTAGHKKLSWKKSKTVEINFNCNQVSYNRDDQKQAQQVIIALINKQKNLFICKLEKVWRKDGKTSGFLWKTDGTPKQCDDRHVEEDEAEFD